MRDADPLSVEVAGKALAAFETLRELPAGEREPGLAALGDAQVVAEVRRLLAADASLSSMPTPSPTQLAGWLAAPEVGDLRGATVGSCRIERRLAEGGMGRVYLARQEPPGRAVAVKILRQALPDETARRRFEEEMRVLSTIEHPGVSRVYEAGTWRSGSGEALPYFAMELVDGARPITTYAREEGLDVAARVRLFEHVAQAVTAIHGKGVIHRDLKPGNVLVDVTGRPVVIDFGIARAAEAGTRTRTGAVLGTPAYMAPEQVLGRPEDVDVRSDVHALGVILYELLAERLPRDVGSGSLGEVVDAFRARGPTPLRSVAPTLPQDLRAVVEKAIETEPSRRYASVAELSSDLARWRERRPVAARPPSPFRASGLFVRRHLALTGLSAALLASIATALVLTSRAATREIGLRETADRQRGRAEDLLRRSRALVPWLLTTHGRTVAGLPKGQAALNQLADGVRTHLEALALDQVDDLDVLLVAARSYALLATLGFNTGVYSMGDPEQALRDAERAVALARRVQEGAPSSDAFAVEADARLVMVVVDTMRARFDRAEEQLGASARAGAEALRREPLTPNATRRWHAVAVEVRAAQLHQRRGDATARRRAADRAMEGVRTAPPAPPPPAPPASTTPVAGPSGPSVGPLAPFVLHAAVRVEYVLSRSPAEEAAAIDAALDDLERLAEAAALRGDALEIRSEHYRALAVLGDKAEESARADAAGFFARAERALTAWIAVSPGDMAPIREYVGVAQHRGYHALVSGHPAEGLAHFEEAIRRAGAVLAVDPQDAFVWIHDLLSRVNAAECCLRLGRSPESDRHLEDARAVAAEIARRFPTRPEAPLAAGHVAGIEADLAEIRAGDAGRTDAQRRELWSFARERRAKTIERYEASVRSGATGLEGWIAAQRTAMRSLDERLGPPESGK